MKLAFKFFEAQQQQQINKIVFGYTSLRFELMLQHNINEKFLSDI